MSSVARRKEIVPTSPEHAAEIARFRALPTLPLPSDDEIEADAREIRESMLARGGTESWAETFSSVHANVRRKMNKERLLGTHVIFLRARRARRAINQYRAHHVLDPLDEAFCLDALQEIEKIGDLVYAAAEERETHTAHFEALLLLGGIERIAHVICNVPPPSDDLLFKHA